TLSRHCPCLVVYLFSRPSSRPHRHPPSFPTRRSSDLFIRWRCRSGELTWFGCFTYLDFDRRSSCANYANLGFWSRLELNPNGSRSEEHTSELQSRENLVCRLLLEKKKQEKDDITRHT